MLPFLKKQKVAGLIIQRRKPDEAQEQEPATEGDAALESAADAIISAIESKDAKSLASAMRDAFEIMESQPHEEFDHESDEEIE